MRKPEQAVDTLLQGLGEVKAPAGMEHRLLLAIRQRAGEPARMSWRGRWELPTLSFGAVQWLAGSAACAGLLGALIWVPKPHRHVPIAAAGRTGATWTSAAVVAGLAVPVTRADGPLRRATYVHVVVTGEGDAFTPDALALAETRAPSQVAPPLPSTEQERLLMMVAIQPDAEQIAALNPEARAKQELQAKVEFQNFFEPVRPTQETQHQER